MRLGGVVLLAALLQVCAADYEGELRLLNYGGPMTHGLLQVYHAGRWGTVCDDYFSQRDADVACRQMGFPGGRFPGSSMCWRFHGRYVCGWGYHIWMDNVQCAGAERRLQDCRRLPWGWHNCNHWEDVVLECNPRPKWWIEWSFKDSTEIVDYPPGSYIYARLYMERRVPPQMWHYLWSWNRDKKTWRANLQENIIIKTWAQDDTSLKYDVLKDWQVMWVHVTEIGQREPNDFIDILKRGVTCHDVMTYVKLITTKKNEEEEVAIDTTRSWCWEHKDERPWGVNWLQHEWKLYGANGTASDVAVAAPGNNNQTTQVINPGQLFRRNANATTV